MKPPVAGLTGLAIGSAGASEVEATGEAADVVADAGGVCSCGEDGEPRLCLSGLPWTGRVVETGVGGSVDGMAASASLTGKLEGRCFLGSGEGAVTAVELIGSVSTLRSHGPGRDLFFGSVAHLGVLEFDLLGGGGRSSRMNRLTSLDGLLAGCIAGLGSSGLDRAEVEDGLSFAPRSLETAGARLRGAVDSGHGGTRL